MGKSTISTGPLSIASIIVCLPEGTSSSTDKSMIISQVPTTSSESLGFLLQVLQTSKIAMNDCQNRFKVDSAAQPIYIHPKSHVCLVWIFTWIFHKWLYPHSWMVYNGKSFIKIDDLAHDGSMVLLYMVTWIPSIYPSHVSIYIYQHHGSYW